MAKNNEQQVACYKGDECLGVKTMHEWADELGLKYELVSRAKQRGRRHHGYLFVEEGEVNEKMDGKKLRAIVKRPDEKYGHVAHINNTLIALQNIVEGYIEAVAINENTVLIVNEEGKIRGMQTNFLLGGDVITGTAVVLGVDGEEFCDCPLTFEQWKLYLAAWGNKI